MIYPDGYVQLKDRSKDIIISGGENISSIEVEDTLFRHPAVAMAAVVAMPHEKCAKRHAYVEFAKGATVDELRDWCKQELAGYKVPGKFVLRRSRKPHWQGAEIYFANRF